MSVWVFGLALIYILLNRCAGTYSLRKRRAALFFFFSHFRQGRFAEQQERRRGRRIFERKANHLGRIDDAGFDQIDVLSLGSIEFLPMSNYVLLTSPFHPQSDDYFPDKLLGVRPRNITG